MNNTLQQINRFAVECPQTMIDKAENDYTAEIKAVAQRVAEDDDIRIVAIAGPSGSGKTTTAHILCDMLEALGEKTAVLSLDDFYFPFENLPVLSDGKRDTESVNALDLERIRKCFSDIVTTGETISPRYDFANSKRIENARLISVGKRGIVIVEGLHALNPLISDLVERKNIFKLYISVNSPILDGTQKLISSRQMRLVRRTLRDEIFRGTDVNTTLSLWENVVLGEEKYLYCYKNTADVQLKTLHFYEPCIFRDRFVALKDKVLNNAPCREYFLKTVRAMEKFKSLDASLVPKNSLIREFIGNGKYN